MSTGRPPDLLSSMDNEAGDIIIPRYRLAIYVHQQILCLARLPPRLFSRMTGILIRQPNAETLLHSCPMPT